MKCISLFFCGLLLTVFSFAQPASRQFVSTDINHFWTAYDKITSTRDSSLQHQYLKEYYLDNASGGLLRLITVKGYTSNDFIDAINKYPAFWASIRQNTLQTNTLHTEIEAGIQQLQNIYPELRESVIWFSIGALRSNGTIDGNHVLISAEMAVTDQAINTSELPEALQAYYGRYQPRATIALLCTHEYVHTQLDNLLCNTLYEGVAEFVSCFATGKPSTTPSFAFGRKNENLVKKTYAEELFLPERMYNWMWGQNRNKLKERDLGYYVGYRICEQYYKQAKDKQQAIKEMITLDYTNVEAVERFVDQSGFFSGSIKVMNAAYEKSRPTVTAIAPFKNGATNVKPGLTNITVRFSKRLNKYSTGIDFGPLGATNCPKILPDGRVWGADGKTWTFTADLKPNQRYQILISNNFRTEDGVRLKAFLIDFTTTN
jgi:Bacterial Ig-like domain